MDKLHAAGYVYRDMTPSNIWLGNDDRIYLLDLELAQQVQSRDAPFGLGTPGFMSPQQQSRQNPAFADDIYSLGCEMILLITGIDPRRVLHSSGTQ